MITGAETVDWHQLGLIGVAFVCFVIILVTVMPADAGHLNKDDDDPPPTFPMF